MTLFIDEEKPEPGPRRKWFWRLFKIACVLAVLFFLGIVLLTRIGGNDDNLRMGLQTAIGRAAGNRPVSVGALHGISFFPYIRVFAENISILPLPASAAAEKSESAAILPEATLGTLMFSRSFWDSFFWRNGIEGIRLEKLVLMPGFITPRTLAGDIVMEPATFEGKPGISFKGSYDGTALDLLVGLTLSHKNLRPVFSVTGSMPFLFTHGDTKVRGRMAVYDRRLFIVADEAVIDGAFFGLWNDTDKKPQAAQCLAGAIFLEQSSIFFSHFHAAFDDGNVAGQGVIDTEKNTVALYFSRKPQEGEAQDASLQGDWNAPVRGSEAAPDEDRPRFPPLKFMGIDESHACAPFMQAGQ